MICMAQRVAVGASAGRAVKLPEPGVASLRGAGADLPFEQAQGARTK